ncbi:DUF2235 domain-containing protein [Streptomyces piniterrae]|uniref:DUF2235 domain-containing protein n=1 Tax=Streptomyces piniterrae TaxID=2571125 RepID=A0A4U0NR92_9ACTN|nr:DUF2235 domain-containing protein [Streptomyces piniterrae]TJZ57099.1 DUF2235 domain-containing protein [Streptomyces piniterrae]
MAKRLIVCCDGTWNLADQPSKTNVTKVALSVRPQAAGVEQRVYYHSGVGTSRWERLRGGAFGAGLSGNIMDAYRFLIDAYEPGDVLYLFGFSRGAFTARSLAGLVRNCGILRRENADRIKEAWALYRDRIEKPTGTASTLFRRAYAHETGIHFIGVWDTVGSLGIPDAGPRWLRPVVSRANRRWEFHDTGLSSWVKGAFHALAIDEQRTPFRPTLWHQRAADADSGQELKQVWFSGVHTDVGGGYKETGLSDITLLWMVHQARRYGLEFDAEVLSETGPRHMTADRSIDFRVLPDSLGMVHDSHTGLYRLDAPWHRPIGQAADKQGRLDGCEYLSQSAKERHDKDTSYRPPELDRYLDQGPVRLEEPVPVPATSAQLPPTSTDRTAAA